MIRRTTTTADTAHLARNLLRNEARRTLRESEQLARTDPDAALRLVEHGEGLAAAALDDARCFAGLAYLGVEVSHV